MAIIVNSEKQLFTLQTSHSTYQMKVGPFGYLLHLYYGAKVADDEDLSAHVTPVEYSFSGNPNEAGMDRNFSVDTLPQEYSTFGSGDFRSACLIAVNGDGSRESDLRYVSHTVSPGAVRPQGLPYVYDNGGEGETLSILLEDPVTHLQVTLHYTVFEKLDTITRHAVIHNATGSQVELERALSACLDFRWGDYDLISFYGRHVFERAPERTPVRHGKLVVDSVRGASSHHENPFAILCSHDATEDSGECVGLSLLYSGNFLLECEHDQLNQTRLTLGLHPQAFRWLLEDGDSFTTPVVSMVYSGQGLSVLSQRQHTMIRHNVCRGEYKLKHRPVLINNWEGTYFDFDEEKLYQIAKNASKIGIEMLVMDDGWFGKREGDTTGLGDWFVNENKIHGGLKKLVDRINGLGMKFGIWFEPEMISEDSDLYRTHPEWRLCPKNRPGVRSRYQFVLDMSRQDVCDYLFERMSDILSSANIEYVKWDMNRHLANVWSERLPAGRQGEVYHRFVLGVYDLLERITTAFPHVLFEGCSGGGGRFDAGMLYYTPQIWCSDDTDAIERVFIQYGTSFGYPVCTMGSHVSAVPNGCTGRSTPLTTRGVVASSGNFGYELDLSLVGEEELAVMKKQIEIYQRQYDLVAGGNYYRLLSPYQGHIAAWQFASPDGSEALLDIVQLKSVPADAPLCIRLRGLQADAKYRVTSGELNNVHTGNEELDRRLNIPMDLVMSGAALMNAGLYIYPHPFGDFDAKQFEIRKI